MNDQKTRPPFEIRILLTEESAPKGKLAEAEIYFHSGPCIGLKLIGFAVWERRGGQGLNVTYPARQYQVNGERRSFALLRPVSDPSASENLRDLIVDAYRAHVAAQLPPAAVDRDGFQWAPDTTTR